VPVRRWLAVLSLGLLWWSPARAGDNEELAVSVARVVTATFGRDAFVVVQVRRYGSLSGWFEPRRFQAGLVGALGDRSLFVADEANLFDDTALDHTRRVLAAIGAEGFVLLEVHPAGERVDVSVSGWRLDGSGQALRLEVVSRESVAVELQRAAEAVLSLSTAPSVAPATVVLGPAAACGGKIVEARLLSVVDGLVEPSIRGVVWELAPGIYSLEFDVAGATLETGAFPLAGGGTYEVNCDCSRSLHCGVVPI